jgi:hypothetical protein
VLPGRKLTDPKMKMKIVNFLSFLFFFPCKEDEGFWDTKKTTHMLGCMVPATRCEPGIVRIQIKNDVYCPREVT